MNDEYDLDDLEQDASYKKSRTPQEIMEHSFNDIYKRDYKLYLQSIEWDTWCKRLSKEEQQIQFEEIQERKRQAELKYHPFNKFF